MSLILAWNRSRNKGRDEISLKSKTQNSRQLGGCFVWVETHCNKI